MKIVFCLPASSVSSNYFNCWNATLAYLSSQGIECQYSMYENAIVAFTRNVILGANNLRGEYQVPFNGEIKYDYLFWIDHDIVWKPEQILQLINHDKDIVSGCYITTDNNHYPICKDMRDEVLLEKGNYQFISRKELAKQKDIFKVDYVGFGFAAIKYGVFESLTYPWFELPTRRVGHIYDITSEDVHWCMKIREKGFDIWVDPKCIVGHEKKVILQ